MGFRHTVIIAAAAAAAYNVDQTRKQSAELTYRPSADDEQL
jgi:hypothetical protein